MSETNTPLDWDFSRIQALIDGEIEERYDLEFKGARALRPKDMKSKEEIVKDVSAMANSAGGTIIYGIKEKDSPCNAPYAMKLDPVNRSVFSSDTLDQIIQSIQPKIDGVLITPIDVPKEAGKAFYVVTIPPSVTAHQARDKKYHKRRNTTTEAMEDYEIRDVMNRAKFPRVKVSFIFEPSLVSIGLKILVYNEGEIAAHVVRVFIRLPSCLGFKDEEGKNPPYINILTMTQEYCWKNLHHDFVGISLAPGVTNSDGGGSQPTKDCYVTRDSPILPKMNQTSNYALGLNPSNIDQLQGEEITWEAYADNAPVRSGHLNLDQVYKKIYEYYSKLDK